MRTLLIAIMFAAMASEAQTIENYGETQFGGSSYVLDSAPPAWGGAYAEYGGGNMPAMSGRFNALYGAYDASPGSGDTSIAAGYGTGTSRGAGTGYGMEGRPPGLFDLHKKQTKLPVCGIIKSSFE